MNYFGSIDLMKLPGAYIGSDSRGKNVVVIPVEWSDITISEDMKRAPLKINMNHTGDKYRETCMKNNASKPGYVPPSHTLALSFSKERREKLIRDLAAKIVEKEHPEWITLDPFNTPTPASPNPLYEECRKRININIGTVTESAPAVFNGVAPAAQITPSLDQQDDDMPF